MKKTILLLCIAGALLLTACGIRQAADPSSVHRQEVRESPQAEAAADPYLDGASVSDISPYEDACQFLYLALRDIYDAGTQAEYRSFLIKESDGCKAYVVKSMASSPFELITEIKQHIDGFDDLVFQAIHGESSLVFTEDSYWFISVDGTRSAETPLGDTWLEKNPALYDAFLDWDTRENHSGADMSPWTICCEDSWKRYTLSWGYYDTDTNCLVGPAGDVTVYKELYSAGDVIYFLLDWEPST